MTRRTDGSQKAPGGLSRRTLIATSAGVATTAAVGALSPAAAVAIGQAEAASVPIATPSTPIPAHPVVAYVHDAARGEVTIVSGQEQHTFRDAALVKRLLSAASSSSMAGRGGR